ncbi:MAG: hypothetical protein K9H48_12310 [Melioribacteraceae bacterium]|nr:hypothetical protein [Melioribacteraceae bacterium]MCF8395075.1 hypothetical protein [Melioribacteraceae bacterium]MCF8420378.1 hypothetical protein [Melioribacteraceae bacterium]
MKVNKILENSNTEKIELNIRILEDQVLIEGTEETLSFLSKVINALACQEEDCGLQLSPNGAGKSFFSKESEYGIYIHRLPCGHKKQP